MNLKQLYDMPPHSTEVVAGMPDTSVTRVPGGLLYQTVKTQYDELKHRSGDIAIATFVPLVEPVTAEIPAILFDGHTVLMELGNSKVPNGESPALPEHVSQVLDAVVWIMKRDGAQ